MNDETKDMTKELRENREALNINSLHLDRTTDAYTENSKNLVSLAQTEARENERRHSSIEKLVESQQRGFADMAKALAPLTILPTISKQLWAIISVAVALIFLMRDKI